MLRVLFILLPSLLIACSKDKPAPVAPAGKAVATVDAPAEPTNLRVEALTDTSAKVAWDAVEGATDYDLNYRTLDGRWTNEPHKGIRLWNIIYDLEPDTEYRWAIRAENRDGASDWVYGKNFTTLAVSSTPISMSPGNKIPDDVLRRAIEEALNKQEGEDIADSEMATLIELFVPARWQDSGEIVNVTSLVGLERAINLVRLDLRGGASYVPDESGEYHTEIHGRITDITPLGGLTKLEEVYLNENPIVDASALSNLTKLEILTLNDTHLQSLPKMNQLKNLWRLWVSGPHLVDVEGLKGLDHLRELMIQSPILTDISSFQYLTSLRWLDMTTHLLSDISSMEHLTNLTRLTVYSDKLQDITPLSDLMHLHFVDLTWVSSELTEASQKFTIPRLQERGAMVRWNMPIGTFDIEIVFTDGAKEYFNGFAKGEELFWEPALHRWLQIIREGVPKYTFQNTFFTSCGSDLIEIKAGDSIDDLRIYVTAFEPREHPNALAYGYPVLVRENNIPVIGCIGVAKEGWFNQQIVLHEIGHVLGIGTTWEDAGLLQNPGSETDYEADTHFSGEKAIQAFDDIGGATYPYSKVPVEQGPTPHHWRGEVIYNDIMSTSASLGGSSLSTITVGALEDLGYTVDYTQADIPIPSSSLFIKIFPNGPPDWLIDDLERRREGKAAKVVSVEEQNGMIAGHCPTVHIPNPIYTWEIE